MGLAIRHLAKAPSSSGMPRCHRGDRMSPGLVRRVQSGSRSDPERRAVKQVGEGVPGGPALEREPDLERWSSEEYRLARMAQSSPPRVRIFRGAIPTVCTGYHGCHAVRCPLLHHRDMWPTVGAVPPDKDPPEHTHRHAEGREEDCQAEEVTRRHPVLRWTTVRGSHQKPARFRASSLDGRLLLAALVGSFAGAFSGAFSGSAPAFSTFSAACLAMA